MLKRFLDGRSYSGKRMSVIVYNLLSQNKTKISINQKRLMHINFYSACSTIKTDSRRVLSNLLCVFTCS